jgi:predicted transcriptional regulator
MSDSSSLTFRAGNDLLTELERLASATDRSRSWHLERALEQYLISQSWQVKKIERGLEDFATGRTIDREKVATWLQSWGSDREGEPPA